MRALHSTPMRRASFGHRPEARTVDDVMMRDVRTISPDTGIHEAARVLRQEAWSAC